MTIGELRERSVTHVPAASPGGRFFGWCLVQFCSWCCTEHACNPLSRFGRGFGEWVACGNQFRSYFWGGHG
jgi:hypothetical protein